MCCLFGPSAAGGAYIPSFCDVVFMVEGNASMYLGSPRMAEMVIGEVTSLEEMGRARMHATVSGCGDNLAVDDEDALDQARLVQLLPQSWRHLPPHFEPRPPAHELTADMVPPEEHVAYDVHDLIGALVDEESFFERMPLFAPELVTGLALLDGRPVGVVANNPMARAASCSSTPPTRPLGSSGCATPSTSRWCSWPTCPGSWSAPRSSGPASSATAPRWSRP